MNEIISTREDEFSEISDAGLLRPKKKDVSRSDHAVAFGDAIKSNLYPCCIVLG